MDSYGNNQPRKKLPKGQFPQQDGISLTLNCRPDCFANSLRQHAAVHKDKVI